MKLTESKILAIAILAIIINFFAIIIDYKNHPEYVYHKQKAKVEAAVQTILETDETDGIKIPGISKIDYRYKEDHPFIVFQTFGFGLAPSSKNFGFYYSVNSVPVAYKGNPNSLKKYGDYWRWHSMLGSSRGEAKHIEGKWYTYKYSN